VSVADKNFLPRMVPLLLMVAGVVVAPRHLARPVESMLVLPGSELDHVPSKSGTSGQFPLTLETMANCNLVVGRGREMVRDGA